MNVCTYFLLFGILAYANSSYLRQSVNSERHVKAARTTDREFNIKENLKNVFKSTNVTVTADNDMQEPYSHVETFTDFIAELINILNIYYCDDMFEDFFDILDIVIRKYHNRNCKYYDLKGKHEFRSLMAAKLDSFAELTVKEKRKEINKILLLIRLQTANKNIKEFLDYVNSLYSNNTKGRFRLILTVLKSYGVGYSEFNTKDDFINLVRECIKATVFYHTDLGNDVREKLKRYMETFMNNFNVFLLPTSHISKLNHFKPTTKKINITTVKMTDIISTKDKINQTSLKTESTRTIEYLKENNKRITTFKTETNEAQSGDVKTLRETSKNERKSVQKIIKHSNTETVMEEMFFMTTEEPRIVFKSEIRSKLVERMLGNPAGTVATIKTTSTELPSSSKKQDLRRSIAPPLPGEELSIEIFDRESRRIKKKSNPRSNSITTERSGLNDYNNLKRHLEKKVDRLKKNYEMNRNVKARGKGDNDDRDREEKKEKESMKKNVKKEKQNYETKDKKHTIKRKERRKTKNSKLVSDGKSNGYDAIIQRNKNKVKNTEYGYKNVKKTSTKKEDEHRLKRKDESIKSNNNRPHKLRNKKKIRRNKSKSTKKYSTTCKCDTNDTETSTKRSKKKSVLKSIEPIAYTKDTTENTTVNNEKLDKTILNATKEVVDTFPNVSKEVKEKRIDDTTDSTVKVTEDNLDKETSTQRYRRVFEAFPSIFKGEMLKEGFYPANLWD